MKKKIILGLVLLFTVIMTCSCFENDKIDRTTQQMTTAEEKTTQTAEKETTEANTAQNEDGSIIVDKNTDPSTLDTSILDEMSTKILRSLSLEEKIGQMFIANIELLDPASPKSYQYQDVTEMMQKSMDSYKPGGLIFFSRNIKTRKQTKKFIRNLQDVSGIPLFISVDEEGGEISRIANNDKMGTTKFPNMAEIGATGDAKNAFSVGDTIGKEMKQLGFNLDFAPVADINTNPDSPEIGDRSFGSDVKLVSKMVPEVVKGLQGQGVSSALKHFPGHGDASSDTHKGYANITQSIKRLRAVEFKPFQAGIRAGADFVMVSHLAINNVTGDDEPASMSRLMITDILRNELGYKNIVITDALNMKAITSVYTPGEAATTAVKAGADMLLMPNNLDEAYEALQTAVLDGDIDESRIDESVSRILQTKIKRGIIPLDSPLLIDQSTK